MSAKFAALFFAVVLVFAPCGADAAEETLRFDVAVIGAGTGGTAAAVQAARMGASVALIEETNIVGGQMTAAAVSTMDDVRQTRTGFYGEFIRRASKYYEDRGTPVNICYWGGDTFSFEPSVAQLTLEEIIRESENITLFLRTRVLKATLTKNKVSSVVAEKEDGEKITIAARVFIDATETGDFIPLTGARYRVGNGIAPDVDKNGVVQDITYVAVIRKYPDGVPSELKLTRRPPGYEDFAFHFRNVVALGGSWWPGDYPYNVPVHNAYRALPDVSNPNREIISGASPSTWGLISRTCVNWANDYPGRNSGTAGMPVDYIEDKNFRKEQDRLAMAETLSFIFYMQTELGMSDWSVDDRQGYGEYFTNDWQNWEEMPEDFAPILKHFPPYPYVRESRRIVGTYTMTVNDVKRDMTLRRTLTNKSDGIALGEYPTDIHGLRDAYYLDRDLNEKPEDIPNDAEWKGGLFQIPIGVLIPEKTDGLLAAEKNISVSRVVNGSTRLQPVTMLTGQAAGALAAEAARQKIEPREVRPLDVQWKLLEAKDKLSMMNFLDVPPESVWWRGAELSVLYGYMDAASEHIFGVDHEMHWLEVRDAFRRAFGKTEMPKRDYMASVTRGEFAAWLGELCGDKKEMYKRVLERFTGDDALTKGALASCVAEMMYLRK